jgi:hypothetical protein
MNVSPEERVRELAEILGIPIANEDIYEVANRLDSLIKEMERLQDIKLSDAPPLIVFPDPEA